MPYFLTYDPVPSRLLVRCEGALDARDLAALNAEAAASLSAGDHQLLVDSRRITSLDITPEGMDAMLVTVPDLTSKLGRGRSALLVHERHVDIASLYLLRIRRDADAPDASSARERSVFTDEAAALAWLDTVPP